MNHWEKEQARHLYFAAFPIDVEWAEVGFVVSNFQPRSAEDQAERELYWPCEARLLPRSLTESGTLEMLIGHWNPRVRVEAMRALSRIPTAQSDELVFDAALQNNGDPFLEYAAWLSINDLAKPWTEAIASGEWKVEGHEKQLAYGLAAIDPALAQGVMAKVLAGREVPRDGSGPWIELIGKAGGPAELKQLYLGLMAGIVPDGDQMEPLAPRELAFSREARPRVAAALLEAARVRGVKPENPYLDPKGPKLPYYEKYRDEPNPPLAIWQFFAYPLRPVRADVLRLLGYWKVESALPATVSMVGPASPPDELAALFESLRVIGSQEAAETAQEAVGNGSPLIRRLALLTLAAIRPERALPFVAATLNGVSTEEERLAIWRELLKEKTFPDLLAAALPQDLEGLGAGGRPRRARSGQTGRAAAETAGAAGRDDGDGGKGAGGCRVDGGVHEARWRPGGGGTGLSAAGARLRDLPRDRRRRREGRAGDDFARGERADGLHHRERDESGGQGEGGLQRRGVDAEGRGIATGIKTRETETEVFLRDVTGHEQAVVKAKITGTQNVGSIMPAGLVDGISERERWNLFAFLGQLGKPGNFDASQGHVARVWTLRGGPQTEQKASPAPPMPVYTLTDGRLTKEQLAEALTQLAPMPESVIVAAQFQSSGPTRLTFTGVNKAWLDGQPLAVASEPKVTADLAAGVHTITVQLDPKALPEVLRVESPDARFLGN